MSMRASRDRQKMWCLARAFGDFSIAEITEACDISVDSARKYIWMLRRHGYVYWQKGDTDNSQFKLVRDSGGYAPTERGQELLDSNKAGRVEDISRRLWTVICLIDTSWDCYELAAMAQVTYASAFRYSQSLVAHEYAKCDRRDTRIKESRNQYRLLLKTGAIAPLFLEDGTCFDANLFLKTLWDLKSKRSKKRAKP